MNIFLRIVKPVFILYIKLLFVGSLVFIAAPPLLAVLFNLEARSLYGLASAICFLLPFLTFLFIPWAAIGNNSNWILGLPLSKKRIITFTFLFNVFCLLVGAVFLIFLFTVLAINASDTSFHEFYLAFNVNALKVISNLNSMTFNFDFKDHFVSPYIFTIIIFPLSFLLLIPGNMNNIQHGKPAKIKLIDIAFFQSKRLNRIITRLVLFLGFLLFSNFFLDNGFSTAIIIFILSFILPGFLAMSYYIFVDESRSKTLILRSLCFLIFAINSTLIINGYSIAKDQSRSASLRLDVAFYLGSLAPEFENDFLDKIDYSKDFDYKDIENLNLKITPSYFSNLLRNNKDIDNKMYHLVKLQRNNKYKLDFNKVDIDLILSNNLEHIVRIFASIKLENFDSENRKRLFDKLSLTYSHSDRQLCFIFKDDVNNYEEIKSLLQSESTQSRLCGLIFSRYNPQFDLSNEIYEVGQTLRPEEFQTFHLTISNLIGKNIRFDKVNQIPAREIANVKRNCPKDLKQLLKSKDEMPKDNIIRCIRTYKGHQIKGIDSIDFLNDPLKFLKPLKLK